MKIMKTILKCGIIAHFTMILFGICHLDQFFCKMQPFAKIYTSLSYAGWQFGFFSLELSKDVGLICSTDNDSKIHFKHRNLQTDRMMYGLNKFFTQDSTAQHLISRSWAVLLLNEHPNINQVKIDFYEYKLPSIQQAKQNIPIQIKTIYATSYQINDHALGATQ